MIDSIPTFLANNRDLWKSWNEMQSKGSNSGCSNSNQGWRIEGQRMEDGSFQMTLRIRFKSLRPEE